MTKIVGILNITHNSFSDGGKYDTLENAKSHYHSMLKDGADFVDIGAQSTAYGAKIIDQKTEWNKLQPLLAQLKEEGEDLKKISIDTFNYQTAAQAIDMGVGMINDVKGCQSSEMLSLITANSNVKYIAMLSVCIPARHDLRISNFQEITNWMRVSIQKMKNAKIEDEQIILDPGIGFATGPQLSFEVIKKMGELKRFGYPIMIGASRKTFISSISNLKPKERDLETVLLSCNLKEKAIEYVRVHNVAWHKRAFSMMEQVS